jgi:hypothetical protein
MVCLNKIVKCIGASYFVLASFLPDCLRVVRAFTGDFAFTARASFRTR